MKYYWTTKTGNKIDIDEMSIEHLRNVLKMIIKQNQSIQEKIMKNVNNTIVFSDEEIGRLTNKTQYQSENEENIWK